MFERSIGIQGSGVTTQLVNTIVAGIPLPLLVIGTDDRIHFANDGARAIFGADIIGRKSVTVIRQPAFLDCLEGTMRHGQPGTARIQIIGQGRDTSYRITTTSIDAGGLRGVMAAFEDVTDLEQAEAIRRDFVANVSHELRTPLTALLGFIETLRGAARDDPAARDRFLTIMEREAGRMNRLVRDLLSLSRVEAEERRRPIGRVDLTALLRTSLQALRPMAEAANITFDVQGADISREAPADPDQITQVFSNLIENAIKYGGNHKTVTICISRIEGGIGLRGPAVKVEIIDQGDGIDPIHIPRLTERFYRIDAHRSREQGGTGLGLAIVKHIINRHRGRFRIESEIGKGSRFSMILPEE